MAKTSTLAKISTSVKISASAKTYISMKLSNSAKIYRLRRSCQHQQKCWPQQSFGLSRKFWVQRKVRLHFRHCWKFWLGKIFSQRWKSKLKRLQDTLKCLQHFKTLQIIFKRYKTLYKTLLNDSENFNQISTSVKISVSGKISTSIKISQSAETSTSTKVSRLRWICQHRQKYQPQQNFRLRQKFDFSFDIAEGFI